MDYFKFVSSAFFRVLDESGPLSWLSIRYFSDSLPPSREHVSPSCAPERMATASLFFGRYLMMPCCSFWTMAGQWYCPRRIAKHLSKAGFLHWQRNFVTRFLQKNLVSICVIAFDVNFIEDRKSVAIGDFWTNEHPDEPVGAYITNWHPINYADLKRNVNMLITLFFYGSEHIEKQA